MIVVETFERGGGPRDPPSVRTRDHDRGRMTPNNASSQCKPAGGHRRRRQADHTLIRSDPTTRTADRTDIDRPGRARSHSRHARSRSLCRPSARSTSIEPVPDAAAHRRQPSNPHRPHNVASGPRGFLVWGRGCQAPISRLASLAFPVSWFDLEARFFVPTHRSRTAGARRGRQDRPSLKPFPKLRRGEAAS